MYGAIPEPLYDTGYGGIAGARRHVPPKARISEDGNKAILTAVQQELRRLLDAEKFGVKQLSSIARLAEQTRMMLADLAVDIKDIAKQAQEAGELDGAGDGAFGGALSPSPFGENYGGQVIRQLMPALSALGQKKEIRDSLSDMVAAAADARKEGLTDLADDIVEQIRERMRADKKRMSGKKEKRDEVVSAKLERGLPGRGGPDEPEGVLDRNGGADDAGAECPDADRGAATEEGLGG
jgi:hypothetical protein